MDNVQSEPETNSSAEDNVIDTEALRTNPELCCTSAPSFMDDEYYRRRTAIELAIQSISGLQDFNLNNTSHILDRAKAFYAFTAKKTRVRK